MISVLACHSTMQNMRVSPRYAIAESVVNANATVFTSYRLTL